MSDSGNVRLVRCPKCENLLPEHEGYSVYQCGGCGAVLRAQNRNLETDSMSQRSEEEIIQGVYENLPNKPEKFSFNEKQKNMREGSDEERLQGLSENPPKEPENFSLPEEKNFKEGPENDVRSNGSSSRRGEKRNENLKADKWIVDNVLERNENLNGSFHAEMGKEFDDSKMPNRNGSQRSESFTDWRTGVDGCELEGFRSNQKKEVHDMRYSTSMYQEDGPSDYHSRSSYGYGEQMMNQMKPVELDKVEYLEQDRAELLRKLDELKDQISRSCDVNQKPKENVSHDPRLARQEGSYMNRPPYTSHYNETSSYMNRHEMGMDSFYPSRNALTQVQRFGDPLRPQMLRRTQEHVPYFSGHYVHNDLDPYEQQHPLDMHVHHPSCSCYRCYSKHTRVPPPVPPTSFQDKMLPRVPNFPMVYPYENRSSFGPWDYNPPVSNHPPLSSHNPQAQTRWPHDLNPDVHEYVGRRPARVVIATGKRRCSPIAGGAPLVTCYNCFQLLELPKKFSLTKKNKKVKCGACSTVILFAIVDKKLVSVRAETNKTPNMIDNNRNLAVRSSNLHPRVHANQASTNFSSDDYDNSGYDFQFMDREVNSSSTGQGFCSNKSENMRSYHSKSSYSSENEVSPDTVNPHVEDSNSTELEAKTNPSPPQAGSPLQDHFDYSNVYRSEKGNRSGRSEREKAESKKVTSRQNSMKDASLATEMEVSFNEYTNTITSQESGDASKPEDQLRINNGGQSFFAGIIKKSFKDFSKSDHSIEHSSSNVTINGHPITDRLLKRAEKVSGPVHPGQYWYDYRAGFWGVMGGPCLGIIPPFIEEFNYPMPENCASGNTNVFVNGRELHQKDLDLLSSRGLPGDRHGSYIIEISGRVLDEETGEEIESLGKLAPTVEKAKHGFGMKVPRIVAA